MFKQSFYKCLPQNEANTLSCRYWDLNPSPLDWPSRLLVLLLRSIGFVADTQACNDDTWRVH